MLKIVGSTGTRTDRVLWAVEEIGLPYEHVAAKPRSDEARRFSPPGKVPILVDGDVVVTDSTAILHYLADRTGALTHPAGTPERAAQDAITFAILDEFEGALWLMAKHKFVLPEALRVPAVRAAAEWEVAEVTRRLGALLGDGRPFLSGPILTVPDLIAVHCVGWARKIGFSPDARLADWAGTMRDRPSIARFSS